MLKVKDLSISFINEDKETFHAVKGVSFDLQKGETLGIVGESGSGKSVTSLMLMGLLPGNKHVGGTIEFEEEGQNYDLLHLQESSLRKIRGNKISMIFQEPMSSLNPVLTCGKQVDEILKLHKKLSSKEAKKRTIGLFEKVRLPDPQGAYEKYPFQLSGGQKQRVMIAMAIACDPALLIADEPTTALDVTVQKTVIQLLKDLQKENQTSMIFISHDLGVISEVADKVAVMYKGTLVEYGKVNEVLNNPQHQYTKGLIACRPPLTGKPFPLPTVSDFLSEKQISQSTLKKPGFEDVLIEVSNLNKQYKVKSGLFSPAKSPFIALKDINFNVYKGETLGIVGESGCGKTTLGRLILNLIEPGSGDIKIKGKSIFKMTKAEKLALRKHVQVIFQDPYSSLNPAMTIGSAILEAMLYHKVCSRSAGKQKVIELLEKVGLSESHYDRYPHEFSGGQRQRVCIARALSVGPEFLVCDESVSALDVSVQAQVLNLLNSLKQEFGLTYIFISHDLSVVRYMSDRLMVMNKGQIEEMGNPEEIYLNPQKDYTKKLINAIPKGRFAGQ